MPSHTPAAAYKEKGGAAKSGQTKAEGPGNAALSAW